MLGPLARLLVYGLAPAVVFACASKGPTYHETMQKISRVNEDHVRVVFLRPKDTDDGASGGRAVIRIDSKEVGAIAYGGFSIIDVAAGTYSIKTSGRYSILGECEIELRAMRGAVAFVDIGPRMSYMIAGTVGSVVGGMFAATAGTDVFGSVGEAVVRSSAEMVVGSVAGEAGAEAIESRGKRCSGPYKLELIGEQDALERLEGLVLSK